MVTMSRFAGLLLIVALAASGCSDHPIQWTAADRQNAQNIFESLNHAAKAADLANHLPRDTRDPAQFQEVINQLQLARHFADQVEDRVLDKAHPELRHKFRFEYSPALSRLAQALKNDNRQEAIEAASDIKEFSRWFRNHQYEFRWWDQ